MEYKNTITNLICADTLSVTKQDKYIVTRILKRECVLICAFFALNGIVRRFFIITVVVVAK